MKPDLQTDIDLSLQVAAIAGWENIREWNPNPKAEKTKKVFQGTNKKHPELGIFVPDYASNLSAIWELIERFNIFVSVHRTKYDGVIYHHASAYTVPEGNLKATSASTLPLALCNLLVSVSEPSSTDDFERD